MGEVDGLRQRRVFRWSIEATELVREYKARTNRSQEHNEIGRRKLVTKLAEISGNPRDACLRFLHELGVHQKRAYREWTKPEQQRLLDLISSLPVEEVAKILRRPTGSVRSMLHRLGMGGKTGREWFTKFSLSRALHTRPDEIQKWIDLGWLQARTLSTDEVKAQVIYADDFCAFIKQHGRNVVSRRLSYDALWFVQNYVFPPKHAELLEVRGTYNKRSRRDDLGEGKESTSRCEPEGEGPQEKINHARTSASLRLVVILCRQTKHRVDRIESATGVTPLLGPKKSQPAEVTIGLPVIRESYTSTKRENEAGYFLNSDGQFCTSVSGSERSFKLPLLMRNFFPSAVTSYGPKSRWIPTALNKV